jgi:hypothetical protein
MSRVRLSDRWILWPGPAITRWLSALSIHGKVTLASDWSIKNRLQWQLDVTLQEDQWRIRNGHADTNFSLLRRTALSLLKNGRTARVGLKNKRLKAGWDDDYLQKVHFGT